MTPAFTVILSIGMIFIPQLTTLIEDHLFVLSPGYPPQFVKIESVAVIPAPPIAVIADAEP